MVGPDGTIEDLTRGVDRMRANLDEIRAELVQGRFEGRSPDGRVTAVASAGGALVDLVIDPRVFRNPDSEGLANSVLSAISAATQQASAYTNERVRALVGVDLASITEKDDVQEMSWRIRDQLAAGCGDSTRNPHSG